MCSAQPRRAVRSAPCAGVARSRWRRRCGSGVLPALGPRLRLGSGSGWRRRAGGPAVGPGGKGRRARAPSALKRAVPSEEKSVACVCAGSPRFGPIWARFRPTLAQDGQPPPAFGLTRRIPADMGRSRPAFHPTFCSASGSRVKSSRARANPCGIRTSLAQAWSRSGYGCSRKAGQCWPGLGPMVGPPSARIRRRGRGCRPDSFLVRRSSRHLSRDCAGFDSGRSLTSLAHMSRGRAWAEALAGWRRRSPVRGARARSQRMASSARLMTARVGRPAQVVARGRSGRGGALVRVDKDLDSAEAGGPPEGIARLGSGGDGHTHARSGSGLWSRLRLGVELGSETQPFPGAAGHCVRVG